MAVDLLSARTINLSNWDAGSDGKLRGDDPGGLLGGALSLPSANTIASAGISLSFLNAQANANCGSNAPHRNAYPGIEWDYVIGVHGGRFPYFFEILDGPSGLSIGANLILQNGVYVFDYDHGRLSWQNPTVGNHTISVRVTDQDGTQVTRTWTLVVSTEAFVFLDPTSGSDSGDGSIGSPYLTEAPLSGHPLALCYIDAGTLSLSGSNYQINSGGPTSFIGMPGETVNISQNDAWLVMAGTDDVMLKNLTIFHDVMTSATADRKCIAQISGGDRTNLVDLTFTNYEYGATNAANGAVFYSSGSVNNDQFIHNWDVSGATATVVHTFKHRNSLIQKVRVHDATPAGPDSSSNAGVIRMKDGWSEQTIRLCEIWENLTWGSPRNGSCINIYGQDQSSLGIGPTDICYNKCYHPADNNRDGAFLFWGYGSVPSGTDDIHVYRNSARGDSGEDCWYHDAGIEDLATGGQIDQANAIQNGVEDASASVTNLNNLLATDLFDSSMNLQNDHRTTYLGIRGAEIAD